MRRLACVAALCLAGVAQASETPQPAEDSAADAQPQPEPQPTPDEKPPPETVVKETAPATDDDPVGDYGQPEWTSVRRFPTTRVYVLPGGKIQAEYWLESKSPFEAFESTRIRSLFELSIGIAHRLQVDLYVRLESDAGGPLVLESERVELRWAFADWGVIPGNPTLYLEWIRPHEGPWKGEVKLLFGGAFAPGWHWGANLSFERELWGTQTNEYAVTAAFSHTLLDRKLSLGAEARVELVDVKPNRGAFTGIEFLVGPSLRWFPHPRVSMSLAWLVGLAAERDVGTDPLPSFGALMQPTLVLSANL